MEEKTNKKLNQKTMKNSLKYYAAAVSPELYENVPGFSNPGLNLVRFHYYWNLQRASSPQGASSSNSLPCSPSLPPSLSPSISSTPLSSTPNPNPSATTFSPVKDSCEPCPVHGQCHEAELQCDQGYKKHGKLCVEDGLIQETANKLAERVHIRLCKEYAELMCYGTGTIWVPENDIINDLDNHELAEYVRSDTGVYVYARDRALETINRMLDGRTNSLGVKELKCPDMLADQYKPYSCRIRQWTSEQALLIFPICAALLGLTFLLWKFNQRQYLSNRVDNLYQQVCEELEDKALMNRVNNKCEPWVVASTLRDSLLSLKERPILWRKVEELVQEDSRVDCYPKLVKGESRVVWEWQGMQVDDFD